MKKNEIEIGGVYLAKISNRIVPVRIDSKHSRQGWNATNTTTGKRVHIKTAQRLRGPAKSNETPKAKLKARAVIEPTASDSAEAATVEKKKPATENGEAKPKKAAHESAPKRLGALDAAAKVLADASEPMGAHDLIKAMADQGLWTSPGGKTPHATLYAAIHREIFKKADDARFQKVDRGLFVNRA